MSRLDTGRSAKYQLYPTHEICNHIDFKLNRTISNHSLAGRALFRLGLADSISEKLTQGTLFTKSIETRETSFLFLPNLAALKDPTSFRGFWQHKDYLLPVAQQIKSDLFSVLSTVDSNLISRKMSKRIASIVIHIRRGDFKFRNRNEELGLITLESYRRALRKVIDQLDVPFRVFTVTDDPDSLFAEGIGAEFGKILGPEKAKTWQALKLMAEANYLIASNSTLSWWGSFLCQENGGTAYLPKNHYQLLNTFDAFAYPGFLQYENSFLDAK